jgi:alpha-tubulin suppressor-like RCC1 family protein
MKAWIPFVLLSPFLLALPARAELTVTTIAQGCAAGHSLFLKSDGSLWGMGLNWYGQLGDGTAGRYNVTIKPEEIVASNVVAVAAGGAHSLFLKSDGSLWGMGYNGSGQLGITNWPVNRPVRIVASGVTAIAAGGSHSLFLKSDGSLWAMGDNAFSQLGDGTFNNTNKPERIVARGVVAIAAAAQHSLFLRSDGSLWGMGCNESGQLGHGAFNYNINRPVQIVDHDGRIIEAQRSPGQHRPVLPSRRRIIAIAAGGDSQGEGHSLFLRSDGSLWGMGNNAYGQLADGTNYNIDQPQEIVASNVVAIAAGLLQTLFLKSDGSLWGMGNNIYYQLGDSLGSIRQPKQIVAGNVVAMAAGTDHSLFLTSDGSLWGMGHAGAGALGDGFWFDGISGVGLEQIWPRPQPVLAAAVSNGTDLQLTAPCGFGGDFCLLTGTNLSLPLSQWTPVCTNTIRYRFANVFSATLTNAVSSGNRQFYILQSP